MGKREYRTLNIRPTTKEAFELKRRRLHELRLKEDRFAEAPTTDEVLAWLIENAEAAGSKTSRPPADEFRVPRDGPGYRAMMAKFRRMANSEGDPPDG